jgi:hypothetical protein
MSVKDITIGRVINVTVMIGVSAGIVLLAFGIVLLLFGVVLASILQTLFTCFGSRRGDCFETQNEHEVGI